MSAPQVSWANRKARKLHRYMGRMLGTVGTNADCAQYASGVAWWLDRSWSTPYKRFLARDQHSHKDDDTRILDRRFQLMRFAESVAKISGSTAECGVYRGIGSAMICQTLKATYASHERHFGFDSFAGVSAPDDNDKLANGNVGWVKGQLTTSFEATAAMLSEFAFCQLVQGWIPETFPVAADQRFRLVHIDVDLYEPTLASLQFFYPRLNAGGVIVLDDHGFANCPGARRAALEYFADKSDTVIDLTTGQGFILKRG